MKKPKAILFDYGHTLIYETHFNTTLGAKAIYDIIKRNPNNIKQNEFCDFADMLYEKLAYARRENALEVPATSFTRILREYFEIEFDADETTLQETYWNGISPPVMMEDADTLLEYLKSNGIKCGVISNLWYEGSVLKSRMERILPKGCIDFYMATAQYGFRKPNKVLFDIALKKLGLQANDVWYCGDEPRADITGAYEAGLVPVWINSNINCPYKIKPQGLTTVECLKITRLCELIDILENL